MDINACRQKRYAEMSSDVKYALLWRRRDAYAAKKISHCESSSTAAFQSSCPKKKKQKKYSTKTGLKHLEIGICFPAYDFPSSIGKVCSFSIDSTVNPASVSNPPAFSCVSTETEAFANKQNFELAND